MAGIRTPQPPACPLDAARPIPLPLTFSPRPAVGRGNRGHPAMMLTGPRPGQTVAARRVNAMPVGMMGLKVGMTQVYDEKNKIAPVTVLQMASVRSCKCDQERDGYDAVQIGYLDKKRTKATRANAATSRPTWSRSGAGARPAGVALPPKANVEPQKHVREFRLETPSDVAVGTVLKAADVFKDVKAVDVIGTSKGRGTAGAMKRHNFAGLPASHGVKKHHRSPGSVGSHASNRGSGRPKRGKRMAGRTAPSASRFATCALSRSTPRTTSCWSRGRPRTQRRAGAGSADEQEEVKQTLSRFWGADEMDHPNLLEQFGDPLERAIVE